MYKALIAKDRSYFSVLKAFKSYRNSAAQRKMHQFQQNKEEIQQLRSNVYSQSLRKDSQNYIMIREYLFQEQKPAISVNFTKRYVLPVGKWRIKDLQEYFEKQQNKKISAQDSNESKVIQDSFNSQLHQRFSEYYKKQGKRDYSISVSEEVQKIAQMTDEEFQEYIQKLKNPKLY